MSTLNLHLPPDRSSRPISHDEFSTAVTEEFEAAYGLSGQGMRTTVVREQEVTEKKVWDGVEELKSWEWQYGQTPEFENTIVGDLPFGRVVCPAAGLWSTVGRVLTGNQEVSLSARHAVMKSIEFKNSEAQPTLDKLAALLIGLRYETLEGAEDAVIATLQPGEEAEVATQTVQWLRQAM